MVIHVVKLFCPREKYTLLALKIVKSSYIHTFYTLEHSLIMPQT